MRGNNWIHTNRIEGNQISSRRPFIPSFSIHSNLIFWSIWRAFELSFITWNKWNKYTDAQWIICKMFILLNKNEHRFFFVYFNYIGLGIKKTVDLCNIIMYGIQICSKNVWINFSILLLLIRMVAKVSMFFFWFGWNLNNSKFDLIVWVKTTLNV